MNEMNDILDNLLKKASKYPKIYNKASNWLYETCNMHSAELSLLLTCYIIDNMEDKKDE